MPKWMWCLVASAFVSTLAWTTGVSAQQAETDDRAEVSTALDPGKPAEQATEEATEELAATIREEFTVTAQKREQPLEDVGIAMTVLSADQLSEAGARSTQEIVQLVPGLTLQETRGSWIIRGVGTQTVGMGSEAATAVYLDDSYIYWARGSGQPMFDMAQTEVLKGPQGTLFGRNATGGLIHFRTAEPGREGGGFVDLAVGDSNQARVEAAYGGPLGSRVSGRIAMLARSEQSYYTPRFPGISDLEKDDALAVRGKLRWDAGNAWSLLFTGYHSEQDTPRNAVRTHFVSRFGPDGLGFLVDDPEATDAFGWRNPEGSGVFDTWANAANRETIDLSVGSLKADWAGNRLTFRSITSWMQGKRNYAEDSDLGPVDVARGGSPGFELPNDATTSITQELHLSGGNRLRWILGVFYLTIDQRGLSTLAWGVDFGDFTEFERESNRVDSLAGFGQIEYDLGKRWRVVAGLRYTDETRKGRGESWTELSDGTIVPGGSRDQERRIDKPLSGKVALEFFPGGESIAYASVNRGTKSGGFNSVDLPAANQEFEDERLTAYELGYKIGFGSGTSLNAAAFYYDYDGYQLRDLDQELIELFIDNHDAEIYGGEIELFTQPARNLDLGLGLSLLDATVFDLYREVSGRVFHFPERAMQQAPSVTCNGALAWGLPLGSSGRRLDLRANFNWVATQQYTAFNDPSLEQDPYLYGYASISYLPPSKRWQAVLWVKNLFNEKYRRGGDDISEFGFSSAPMNPPRRFGLTLRVGSGL